MTIVPEIENELREAIIRRAHAAAAEPVGPRTRISRSVRTAARAAPLVLAGLIAVTVAGLVLRLGPSTAPRGNGHGRSHHAPSLAASAASGAVDRAQRTVAGRDPRCRARANVGATLIHGSPPAPLLSALGVLRRPSPPPSSGVLRRLGFTAGAHVYVDSIRLARTAYGKSFYIIPEGNPRGTAVLPDRCYAAMLAAVGRETRSEPAPRRSEVLRLASATIASRRAENRDRASVCFAVVSRGSGGVDVGCQRISDFLRHLTGGLDKGQGDRAGGAINSGIVPDGVATVTVDYAARGGDPARRLVGTVVNNVLVFKVPPRTARPAFPARITWRSSTGRAIRTFG